MAGHDRRCRFVRLASYNQAPFEGMRVFVGKRAQVNPQ